LQESEVAASVKLQIESAPEESGDSGMSLAAIVGIAAAALVPLFATAALLVWRWRSFNSAISEAHVCSVQFLAYMRCMFLLWFCAAVFVEIAG
jgi:hypothetical protein